MKRIILAILFLLFIVGWGMPVGAAVPWHQAAPQQNTFVVAPLEVGSVFSGLDGFSPVVNSAYVSTVAVQLDGKILVGGNFTCIGKMDLFSNCLPPPDGYLRTNLVRFNPDGTIDTTFAPNPNDVVEAISVNKSDGTFIVAGDFTTIAGAGHNYIAKFNADGTIVSGFTAGVGGLNHSVYAVQHQADNKILVGGSFDTVTTGTGPVSRHNLARLNSDGTLDDTFADPNVNDSVYAVDVQSEGHIIIGGIFTQVGSPSPATRNYVARLKSSGSVETDNFATLGITSADPYPVRTIKVHSSGDDVIIGGKFSVTGGITNLVRTGPDGTVNASFKPNPNDTVDTLFVKMNGEILAGGVFSNLLVLIQDDLSGTVDAAFSPSALSGEVFSVVEQPDGKILAGGSFISIDSRPRMNIARFYPNLYKSSAPVAIAASGGTQSVINITPSCAIVDLKVGLQVTHTKIGDLSFSLTHAGQGPDSLIGVHTCNSADIDTILDDQAGAKADAQCAVSSPAINGIFQPSSPLALFDGVTSSGDWTLTITNSGATTGTLNGWGLVLDCASALTVNNTFPGPATGTATVTSTPAGTSCTSASCTDYFLKGSEVSLSGSATGNWALHSWSGACNNTFGSGTFPACVIDMIVDKTVNATFVEVAKFSADTLSGTAPLYVTFTDESNHAPTTWSWNFDSAGNTEGTSNLKNTTHNFKAEGSYTVSLVVNGNSSFTTSKTVVVGPCADGLPSPVRIGTNYYVANNPDPNPIQNAHDAAQPGSNTIEAKGLSFTGNLIFDGAVDIIFSGGFGCAFTPTSALTEVLGSLTLSGTGSAVIDRLSLQ